jgi:hypothetical protein
MTYDHINLQVYQILKSHNIAISDKFVKPWSIENWAHIESWFVLNILFKTDQQNSIHTVNVFL